jgi:HD-GYP domain-containing protein (c-di-GMP phosphodiesterase class II)
LFLGSLKALTSSIDAKDQYTRGHSERVAIIAQWIAQRYAEDNYLEPEQIHNIYLAGLLHDVGKIGIDESVLRKSGKLTKEEYDCIKRHSAIGAGILGEIKQMCDIVPGVLHHHERVDGKGYPDGLKGDSIPLSGKIVGLADSFDAMVSARVYRAAMTLEQAISEIRKGLGKQYDEKVGAAFLNSDIHHLLQIIQNQMGDAYSIKAESEYGSQALETLAR